MFSFFFFFFFLAFRRALVCPERSGPGVLYGFAAPEIPWLLTRATESVIPGRVHSVRQRDPVPSGRGSCAICDSTVVCGHVRAGYGLAPRPCVGPLPLQLPLPRDKRPASQDGPMELVLLSLALRARPLICA